MTKEQEEAIDRINKSYDDNTGYYDASGRDWIIILNMIKEKDAEAEKYKKKNKELSNQILILYKEQDDYNARIDKKNTELKKKNEELDMYKDIKEIANSKVTDLVKLKQYDNLKKKVDKQDKMIDLMAYSLADYVMYYEYDKCRSPLMIKDKSEELKEYYERKATNDG